MNPPGDTPSSGRDEFLLDYLREAPEFPIRDAADLDGKMVALFTAASIVLGLAGIGQLASTGHAKVVVTGFLIAAATAYSGAAVTALLALLPVQFDRSFHADTLRAAAEANAKSVREIKSFLLDSIAAAYRKNTNAAVTKANRLPWMVGFVGAEVALVASALISSRFS